MNRLLFAMIATVCVVVFGGNVVSASSKDACRYVVGQARNSPICQKATHGEKKMVHKVIETISWIVGVASVLMIIWAGIQYTTSSGDSSKVNRAKITIIYSVIGLVISLMAGVIVSYFLTNL